MAFPSSLKKLSLSDCGIAWDDMSTVGSLPNLEVLKLQTRAAQGQVWNPNADEFCRLKFLLIDQCWMETWVADDCHFPCLEHLHLVNMKMEEIPIEFAEVPTLLSIDLNYCSKSLIASAKKISEEREAFGYEEVQVRSFSFEGLKNENVVGFEDEAARLIGYLSNKSEQLEVISIIGMPGIGKTTLAEKIFHDPEIQYEFRVRIWVYVSQEFTRKDIFLSILKEITSLTEDIKCKTDKELANLVNDFLKWRTFLLVMDDLRSCEDWDTLKIALPMSNKWGKVLITSRQEEVGRRVNCCGGPHMLRFLTPEEGNLLLQREVFGKAEYPQELEAEGRVIAERCNGLPLAILLIGGILREMSSTKEAWEEEVSDILYTYLDYDPVTRMERIISLSYGKLPYHMRKCFLYMGMFPQGFEIPAWRLIWLWIAEGLIQQNDDISMEETAENYLEGLISRNFVRVDKLKVDGKVKTCRVHELLCDYCKAEAERDSFFQEIKISSDGGFQFPVSKELEYHRLCIRSSVLKFILQDLDGDQSSVSTIVYFSSAIPGGGSAWDFSFGFKQLRVLDACPIKFTYLHSDMFQSLHLTYMAISGSFHVLPAFFSECRNLQTLIVDTTSQILVVEVDILNMDQLKHFKSNASASLPNVDPRSNGGEKIQTLGMILSESCSEEAFDRARNLKKLAICGKLALFRSFDSFRNLGNLEKLKLKYDVPDPPSGGIPHALPPAYKFPSKLRSLTLSNTYLRWHYMSVLGSLENLEVLKLKDKAFMGTYWTETGAVFPNLEVLHIGRTDLLIWSASHDQFPRLKCLQLRNCENLKQIPICLADIPNLQILDLYNCYAAVESAKKIAKKKEEGQQSGNAHQFKLKIFPSRQLDW